MNDLRCSEVDELLVAYAADALDDDEGYVVATHLAECRNHDAELAAIRGDLEHIAVAVSPVQPPPELRTRLLDVFDREVNDMQASEPQPLPAPRAISPSPRPAVQPKPRPWFLGGGLGYALAAALLVVAIGLGAWGLSRGNSNDNVVLATTTQGTDTLQITYLHDQHLAVLNVNLEAPPAGHAYQAWQIVDGAPVSVGLLTSHTGQTAFSADLDDASAIALSVEPEGGSRSPTTTPILVTPLSNS
jgi:hypothetical protein